MSIDYALARSKMVDNQIRPNDVTSHAVIDAFLSIPREAFVPSRLKPLAYIDDDIEIRAATADQPARYVMEPFLLAKLVQLAAPRAGDIVLEIGAGTGYATAILSRLCGSVVALEEDETLASQASDTLSELGCDNVAVVTGPLVEGYAPEAPYDAILFHGAVEFVPDGIIEQLRVGGRLVAVEGVGNAARAILYSRAETTIAQRVMFNAAIQPLPGFERERGFAL
jgi:protein-L-isoaspartate(D-aspartate) O-methyltransferase